MTNKNKHAKSNPMWGGHFEQGPSELMEAINASIGFDKILYRQDIAGSIAHATMLTKQGILNEEEKNQIINGLKDILADIEAGNFEFKAELEDIHMNVEANLRERIGAVAGKVHTARSRNDQVATDFKLWTRDAIDHTDHMLQQLQAALIGQAEQHAETMMPGFTHLQTAQPVTLGHHLMAYVEMTGRDRSRLADCRKRLNECPLGAAALAGTSFPIDREATAAALGFDAPTRNSLDSVSDRDFAMEYLFCLATITTHMSRLAEEMVIWATQGFKFVTLSNMFTTGSSIMPQKRNPDAAELVRAKTGRVFGALNNLLVVMKGLPLAYSKDMQEDKEPVFDAFKQIQLVIPAMTGMIEDMTVHKARMKEASQAGYSTATDIADWLVRTLGTPFRDAHHVTGAIVQIAEKKDCRLDELSLNEMQSVEPRITDDIFNVLSVEASAASRTSFGGTSPSRVKEAIAKAKNDYL